MPARGVIALAARLAESAAFQNAVLAVIVFTAVLIGLETSDDLAERYRWAERASRGR